MSDWQPIETLVEPEVHEHRVVYLALANGEVMAADASAWVETNGEYHTSTGVYVGQALQDSWAGFVGWGGDLFEKDDDGWHCMRHPHCDERSERVAVTAWMDAMLPLPLPPPPKGGE